MTGILHSAPSVRSFSEALRPFFGRVLESFTRNQNWCATIGYWSRSIVDSDLQVSIALASSNVAIVLVCAVMEATVVMSACGTCTLPYICMKKLFLLGTCFDVHKRGFSWFERRQSCTSASVCSQLDLGCFLAQGSSCTFHNSLRCPGLQRFHCTADYK